MPWFLKSTFRGASTALILGAISAIFLACGGTETATDAEHSPPAIATSAIAHTESTEWTVISEGINLELATPDLGVGMQRFGMVLSDQNGLIKFPVVNLQADYYPSGYESELDPSVTKSALARFYLFPFGTRGIHTTDIEFDRSGKWEVSANIPQPDGSTSNVKVRFTVAEEAQSVTVGQNAPKSESRTLESTGNIAHLTTGSQRYPGLYENSIAESIQRERPFMVVFASPAFCTNAVCGPQVEIASELRETYGEQFDFIHVDLYTNPHEIQGDLSRAQLTPLLDEWGLVSQEWTFIVGSDGLVTHRFENFAPKPELVEALDSIIANG